LDASRRRRTRARHGADRGLLKAGGGPVPEGRRMFEVAGADTMRLAEAAGLKPVVHLENQVAVSGNPGVTWTRLAFRK
jgi:hypothetical protein